MFTKSGNDGYEVGVHVGRLLSRTSCTNDENLPRVKMGVTVCIHQVMYGNLWSEKPKKKITNTIVKIHYGGIE